MSLTNGYTESGKKANTTIKHAGARKQVPARLYSIISFSLSDFSRSPGPLCEGLQLAKTLSLRADVIY